MGLIAAGLNAVGGTLASQWKEYFYVDALPDDVLVTKAGKKVKGRFGGSRYEDDNVISDGSVIAVNDGQCMMIVDQGRIVDFCAEPGEYVFDQNGEPSIFYGELNGEKLKAILKTTFDRLSFGGQAGRDTRVYFFNTKEIIGNKYGTPSTVPFRVVDSNIGLDMDVSIRCFGEYSYRITNPMLFYVNVCGNVEGDYTREHVSRVVADVEPIAGRFLRENDRHAVVDERYGGGRFARQNRKHGSAVLKSVYPGHVHDSGPARPNRILYPVLTALFPLEIVRCGHKAPALPHSVPKQRLRIRRLASGVEEQLSIAQPVAPPHGKGRGGQTAIVRQHRRHVGRRDLAGLDDGPGICAPVDLLDDLAQLGRGILIRNIIATTHSSASLHSIRCLQSQLAVQPTTCPILPRMDLASSIPSKHTLTGAALGFCRWQSMYSLPPSAISKQIRRDIVSMSSRLSTVEMVRGLDSSKNTRPSSASRWRYLLMLDGE